ncbi:MFS transporter [Weissella confusa]|uniref:MFS transporter n=1 Tax=Weissella confusa TaxID=1583 RepID=UPI0010806088|nr:MFS transporter [Weissella confusa]MCT0013810.1 MFS transporter [Weissella confusa]MED4272178.1 MFS transporter [Weissella confusa]MEE0002078.1 MFS transporter [Weissella confusa]TGE70953.1 sugar transporter [Weissella confusa]
MTDKTGKNSFFKEFFSFKTDKEKGLVGVHRALGVGAWDMFNSGSGGLIGSWLLYFLTTFGGVHPGVAAILISVRLFVDMIWAPVVAVISDNFYRFALGRKYGRRRFFMIFCIPTSIAFVLMWIPIANGWSWIYYLISFIVFDICLDLILIPWETMPAEMTEDYTQRNKMGTIRMWAAGLAQPLIALVPTFFMRILPAEDGLQTSAWALFATALVWGVMGIILTWFVYISSWDPILVSKERRELMLETLNESRKKAETPWQIVKKNFANLALTLRIKTFRKHLVLYFATFGVIDSYTTIFVIFASVSFLPTLTIDPSIAGVILAIPLLVMTFTYAPIGAWLLNQPKIGAQKLYLAGFGTVLVACVTYGVTYFMRGGLDAKQAMTAVIVASCVFTIGRNIMGGIPWVVFPMMADIDEVISREKRAGVFAGAMTFVRKFTNAMFNIVIGAIMGIAGYCQDVSRAADRVSAYASKHNVSTSEAYDHVVTSAKLSQQIHNAGFGIAMLMVFFVGALVIWAMWNAATFKLNSKTHGILMSEIDRLREAGVEDDAKIAAVKQTVEPEVKQTIEELTGLDYDRFAWSGDVMHGVASTK